MTQLLLFYETAHTVHETAPSVLLNSFVYFMKQLFLFPHEQLSQLYDQLQMLPIQLSLFHERFSVVLWLSPWNSALRLWNSFSIYGTTLSMLWDSCLCLKKIPWVYELTFLFCFKPRKNQNQLYILCLAFFLPDLFLVYLIEKDWRPSFRCRCVEDFPHAEVATSCPLSWPTYSSS